MKNDIYRKTMIISAFWGCGKTFLCSNQDVILFKNSSEIKSQYSFLNSDNSKYFKQDGWEKKYVDDIEKFIGTVDFIFIGQHDAVLKEFKKRRLPFVMVVPDNFWGTDKEKMLTKQQWFGRIVLKDLRDASFLGQNSNKWISNLSRDYDYWNNPDIIDEYKPSSFFLLKENQYLSDIIEDLYWKKETYGDLYCKRTFSGD